jgi:hypothetical protein
LNTNALRNADVMTSSIRATSHCSVASKKCWILIINIGVLLQLAEN